MSAISDMLTLMRAHVTTKGFLAAVALFLVFTPGGFLPFGLPMLNPVDMPIVSSRALWVHGAFFALALLAVNTVLVYFNITSYYKKVDMQARRRHRM